MSIFKERQNAFENKFAHENLLEFKAIALRNTLLGLWVSRQLGISKDQANDYANSLVRAGVECANEYSLADLVRDALKKGGIELTIEQIERRMARYLNVARNDVFAGRGLAA